MRNIFDHVVESGHFVSRLVRRRALSCYLISMPPSKVCPQCDTIVPLRLKVCKSCQHVFRAKSLTMITRGMPYYQLRANVIILLFMRQSLLLVNTQIQSHAVATS